MRFVNDNIEPFEGSPRCLMVMTSDFYAMGIWRFRVRVPAGVLENFLRNKTACETRVERYYHSVLTDRMSCVVSAKPQKMFSI